MSEAWWVPIVRIPGDTIEGRPRSRSVRLERTRPRSIMVNRAGKRFVNEASEYNSMAGAFHYLDPKGGYVNDPGWIVFDALHFKRFGFLGVDPKDAVPEWFSESEDLRELATQGGNRSCRAGENGRGVESECRRARWIRSSAGARVPMTDGGATRTAPTVAGRTLGPLDTGPFYAVPVTVGAMGTKGGPRTDRDARVLHVDGAVIDGTLCGRQRHGRCHRTRVRRRGWHDRPRHGLGTSCRSPGCNRGIAVDRRWPAFARFRRSRTRRGAPRC